MRQTSSWEDAWQAGRTGWDRGQAAPPLLELLSQATQLPRGRALVPGCGAGYDVLALAQAGYDALGVDIAPTAAARFEQLRGEAWAQPGLASVQTLDFFDASALTSRFDLIWDYTFLCAISPPRRAAWAQRMSALVHQDGELVTLLFPVDLEDATASTLEDPGPPYRLHPEVARALLNPYFTLHALYAPTRSHADRVGQEWVARWRPRPPQG